MKHLSKNLPSKTEPLKQANNKKNLNPGHKKAHQLVRSRACFLSSSTLHSDRRRPQATAVRLSTRCQPLSESHARCCFTRILKEMTNRRGIVPVGVSLSAQASRNWSKKSKRKLLNKTNFQGGWSNRFRNMQRKFNEWKTRLEREKDSE